MMVLQACLQAGLSQSNTSLMQAELHASMLAIVQGGRFLWIRGLITTFRRNGPWLSLKE